MTDAARTHTTTALRASKELMNKLALASLSLVSLAFGGCKIVTSPGGSGYGYTGIYAYDECAYNRDTCESGVDCFNVSYQGVNAGLCTRACRGDIDCPIDARGYNGACEDFGGGGVCFEQCTSTGQCLTGWQCTKLSDGASVCLPY
jgi:hypothetical protein